MKLITTHLQLTETADETAVLTAIKSIEAAVTAKGKEYDTLKSKFDALEQKEIARFQTEFDAEKALALKDGRLDATGETALLKLADNKLEDALAFLKAMPKRNPITPDLEGEEATLASFEKMTWDELDRGNHLVTLKANHKEYYEKRYKKEFPNAE